MLLYSKYCCTLSKTTQTTPVIKISNLKHHNLTSIVYWTIILGFVVKLCSKYGIDHNDRFELLH